ALLLVPASAVAGTRPKCPDGSLLLAGSKGKPKCKAIKVGKARPAKPADAQGQLGQVADALRSSLALVPGARTRLDKKLGRARATKVLNLALDGWEKPKARARAAAVETQTF